MSGELRQDQLELVQKAAALQGLTNVNIQAQTGTVKGDNYLGIIHSVEVTGDDQTKLHLILKSAHTNENFRKHVPMSKAFERESFIYNTIIPKFQSYQKQFNLSSPFTGSARYYGSRLEDKKESILMQNLKEYGYKMWDRMKPMDSQHISLVFSEYARLHAASLALKKNSPKEFEELTKDIHENVFEMNRNDHQNVEAFVEMYFKSGLEAVEGNDKAQKALEKMKGDAPRLFQDLRKQENDRSVVIHGDSWCNNMLFKYEDNQSAPSHVCFIDWQLSRLGSPIMDLSYFFSVCGSKKVYNKLPEYLHQYHQVLSQNLREFNCDPDEICCFGTLQEDWNRNSWYGVFLAMIIIKLMLTDSEDAPNISSGNHEEGGDAIINSLTDFSMSRNEEFRKRLCDLVEFMVDNEYI